MNNVIFKIIDDVLVKDIPEPTLGANVCRREVVMDKETFLMCLKKWVTVADLTDILCNGGAENK